MNIFLEMMTSFKKKDDSDERWQNALLATQQQQLKQFLNLKDEEHLKQNQLDSISCIGNPLLRMKE